MNSLQFLRGVNTLMKTVKLCRQRSLVQVCANLSTGPQQQHGILYEFRTYSIKPSEMNNFMKLTKEHIDIRTAHSELTGYWTVELGGVNQVFHIWKYDDYTHRATVRAALGQDKEWQEKYMTKMLPLLDKQENEITYLVPWCQLMKPEKEGVYEIITFQMKPGGPAAWGKAFRAAINTHVNSGYSTLVGVFHSEFGLLNRVHVLWWHENADTRAAGRHKAHDDPRIVAAVRESVAYLVSQRNMLLIPTPFSPLK